MMSMARTAGVGRVYIRPTGRKPGLGTAIIRWLLNHCRQHFDCAPPPARKRVSSRLLLTVNPHI
jgi:hypothetical protein